MITTGANAAPRPEPLLRRGEGRRRGESVGSNGRYVVVCCEAAGRAAASAQRPARAGAAGRTGAATSAERREGRGRSRERPKGATCRRLITARRLIGGDAVGIVERQHGRQRADRRQRASRRRAKCRRPRRGGSRAGAAAAAGADWLRWISVARLIGGSAVGTEYARFRSLGLYSVARSGLNTDDFGRATDCR